MADEKAQLAEVVKTNPELQAALAAVNLSTATEELHKSVEADPVGALCDAMLTSTPLSLAVSASSDTVVRHKARVRFGRALRRYSPLYPDLTADSASSRRLPVRVLVTALLRQLSAAHRKLAAVEQLVEEMDREAQRSPTPLTQSP